MSENYRITFEHAGYIFILSNLRYEGKERANENEVYSIVLKYYSSKLILKISRWDNSRYDNGTYHKYKCIRIEISKIIEGQIDESLYGFIKFLEYCFDYQLIDIIDQKLQWRVKKIE